LTWHWQLYAVRAGTDGFQVLYGGQENAMVTRMSPSRRLVIRSA